MSYYLVDEVCDEDVHMEEKRHVAWRFRGILANGRRQLRTVLTTEPNRDVENCPDVSREVVQLLLALVRRFWGSEKSRGSGTRTGRERQHVDTEGLWVSERVGRFQL